MSDYSSYDEAIQAILDAQTDVDNKYKSIGNASSTLCDVNQTMLQIPDGSVVRNRGGDVIGYDYKYTTPKLPDFGIIAVDSNTDSGTFGEHTGGGGHSSGGGAGRYRGSYYAGEVVDDPQSTDKMKGSGLVSGVVGAGWAAASVLAKLGKSVASVTADVLEEVDAHFGLNYGPLNVDFGYGTADMANAVRALFGVDNQGNTTMYLEEDVIGALAIQTKEDGFFDSGDITVLEPQLPAGYSLKYIWSFPIPLYEGISIRFERKLNSSGSQWRRDVITTTARYIVCYGSRNSRVLIQFISDEPFTVTRSYTLYNGTTGTATYNSVNDSGANILDSNRPASNWYYLPLGQVPSGKYI